MKYILFSITFLAFYFSYSQDSIAIKYAQVIKASDIKEYITVLASDSLEGRETAQPGQKKAARYIAKQFKSFGIAPHNNTYFQPFYLLMIKPEKVSININGKQLYFLKDYYHISNFSNDSIYVEKAVFITPSKEDIKNKIVFTLLKYRSENEIKELINSGAKAVFFIDEKADLKMSATAYYFSKERLKVLETTPKPTTAVFFISLKTAKKLFKRKITKKDFLNKEVECKIEIKINIESEKVSSENVVAYVEGSDLKSELVVVTAHYDHLGMHDGKIYHGADDDGSGTSAVIALSHAFEQAKKKVMVREEVCYS